MQIDHLTSSRKVDEAKKIVNATADFYSIKRKPFKGKFPLNMSLRSPEELEDAIGVAFGAFLHWLTTAGQLLDYRNRLFHGRVVVEGKQVRFKAKGENIGASVERFAEKEQDVLRAAFGLHMSAASMREALRQLVDRGSPAAGNRLRR